MKHNYEQRRQRRLLHAKMMAEKKHVESNRLSVKAQEMAAIIPMGQPILIGHHSEKWDRRYRQKIHRTMDKSVDAFNTAKYYDGKVSAIEDNRSISSDDPNALGKLLEKLELLKAAHAYMKEANVFLRKGDKSGFLSLKSSSEKEWIDLHKNNWHPTKPPRYDLQGSSANIKYVLKRIEILKQYEGQENTEIESKGIRVVKNISANRVQIFFPDKPDEETRKRLKHAGFHWCHSEDCWQRHLSNYAEYCAKQFLPIT